MKFVLEAKAYEYDLAAEQEILLRHVANRRRHWCIAAALCVLSVAVTLYFVLTRPESAVKAFQVAAMVLCIILAEQGYLDYASGNPKAMLKAIYRGRRGQTAEMLNAKLRLEIPTDEAIVHVYNDSGEATAWDFSALRSVTESDTIFDLCRGGFPKQYLALPKDALREGTVDELRAYLDARLAAGGKGSVRYYQISDRRKKQLAAAKYGLFGTR